MANENDGERFAVDVHDFCETLLERQRKFEDAMRKKHDDFEVEVQGKLGRARYRRCNCCCRMR